MSNLKDMKISQKPHDEGSNLYTILSVLVVIGALAAIYFMFIVPGSDNTSVVPIAEGGHSKGNLEAQVEIVEFGDFQCPACGFAFTQLQRIIPEYQDRVKFTYRHMPLSDIHQFAQKAGEASECAADQGKFWEMHDILFERQDQLTVTDLKEYALELGLDIGVFGQCLDSGKHALTVSSDFAYGASIGVSSTPTFFVNGEKYANLTYEEWKTVLDTRV